MHVWERIEESRGSRHRGKLVMVRQKFTLISTAAAALLVGVWWGWSATPDLGSFPLVTAPNPEVAQLETVGAQEPAIELPAQQSSLLPEIGAIANNLLDHKPETEDKPPLAALDIDHTDTPVTSLQIKGLEENELPAQHILAEVPVPQEAQRQETAASFRIASLERAAPAARKLPTTLSELGFSLFPIPETGCARFSEGRPAVFLALTAGPVLPVRKFASRSDEYLDYANQRATTEFARLSYGANARLSIVFPWGGAIRSGIGYTQFNEQLVYRNSKVRQTTITEIYGPNGEVIGTDTTYITENTILKYNNRHRLIDIPFLVGYEVRYNKVTLAANAGVNLNVDYSNKGSYLGPRDLLPTRFDSDDSDLEPIYKTSVGLSYQASLGLHYQLNDRLDLMAEPYLLYYPNSFTRGTYPLTQKYVAGGIGFGLRVLL